MACTPPVSPTPQTGSTLLEVLAATLILGIGLLGLASLQSNALLAARQAGWSLQADALALDWIERSEAYGRPVRSAAQTQWRARVAQRLPAGTVTGDEAAGRVGASVLTLSWQARGSADATPTTRRYRYWP